MQQNFVEDYLEDYKVWLFDQEGYIVKHCEDFFIYNPATPSVAEMKYGQAKDMVGFFPLVTEPDLIMIIISGFFEIMMSVEYITP